MIQNQVRELLKSTNRSALLLGRASGMPMPTVRDWMTGRNPMPLARTQKLLRAIGYDLSITLAPRQDVEETPTISGENNVNDSHGCDTG